MSPHADLLKEVPLFQFLDERERADLVVTCEQVHYNAGQTIFNMGDPGDAIYIVTAGGVEIFCKNDTGERIVLETARLVIFSAICRCSTAAAGAPPWWRQRRPTCFGWIKKI